MGSRPIGETYVPGQAAQSTIIDTLAFAIRRQDEGITGWSDRVAVMRSYLFEAFEESDADAIWRSAESLADRLRGVPNRPYVGEDPSGDM